MVVMEHDHFYIDELPERNSKAKVNGATKCPTCYDKIELTDWDDPDEAIVYNCAYKCGRPVGERWIDKKECVLVNEIRASYSTPKPKPKKKTKKRWTPKKKR